MNPDRMTCQVPLVKWSGFVNTVELVRGMRVAPQTKYGHRTIATQVRVYRPRPSIHAYKADSSLDKEGGEVHHTLVKIC